LEHVPPTRSNETRVRSGDRLAERTQRRQHQPVLRNESAQESHSGFAIRTQFCCGQHAFYQTNPIARRKKSEFWNRRRPLAGGFCETNPNSVPDGSFGETNPFDAAGGREKTKPFSRYRLAHMLNFGGYRQKPERALSVSYSTDCVGRAGSAGLCCRREHTTAFVSITEHVHIHSRWRRVGQSVSTPPGDRRPNAKTGAEGWQSFDGGVHWYCFSRRACFRRSWRRDNRDSIPDFLPASCLRKTAARYVVHGTGGCSNCGLWPSSQVAELKIGLRIRNPRSLLEECRFGNLPNPERH
jgi:hypothetical protein